MAGLTGSGNRACGHPVPPGARFCPICGRPTTGGAERSQPSTAPLPAVPATAPSAWPPSASPLSAPLAEPEPSPWDSWYAPRRPPSPSGPQPWPAPPGDVPPGDVPPPSADPDAMWVDGLEPAPPGDQSTAMLGGLRMAPAPSGPQRPRRPLVYVIAAAAFVTVVAAIVIFWSHSGSTAASGTTGTTPSASSQDARRQAAVRLSGLLAQSVTDRAAVTGAAEDVRGCGPSLHQDARTFARAAS